MEEIKHVDTLEKRWTVDGLKRYIRYREKRWKGEDTKRDAYRDWQSRQVSAAELERLIVIWTRSDNARIKYRVEARKKTEDQMKYAQRNCAKDVVIAERRKKEDVCLANSRLKEESLKTRKRKVQDDRIAKKRLEQDACESFERTKQDEEITARRLREDKDRDKLHKDHASASGTEC